MFDGLRKITDYGDIALACSIVGILMVLLFPIPTFMLDFLLAFSIGTAFVILMTTLFIHKPLDLSVFPTILLVTTLLRLSLNIASTRLILAKGHSGSDAAGAVIEAFGGFVMQGNVVIGLIVFLILTLINFIVITKGSGRIAEVAARFSLDAMPGKQMAIDADLAAGLLDEATAKKRRKELEDESTFFGAMDGANKFVRGDAIAGLIITFINLIGGMIVGIVQKDLSFDVAVQTYTMLTIGDGLVSQIPSLIISMSAGLLVTKAGSTGSTDKLIFGQLSNYPQALMMTSIVIALMAFLPGLPFVPFALISFAIGGAAYSIFISRKNEGTLMSGAREAATDRDGSDGKTSGGAEDSSADKISEVLHLDLIRVEIGYGLMSLVNNGNGHNLTEQIKGLRKQIIQEYGFIMPSVRIQDNIQLDTDTYVIKIKELEAGRGVVRPGKLMIMDPQGTDIDIPGESTKEPAFGLPAKWIEESYKEEALFNNCTVVDPSTVMTTHLTELIKENITDLLSYSETQKLLNQMNEEHKQLVKDIIPDIVSVASLQKVLQNLLSEMISIRDLPSILESIADAARANKNLMSMTEAVRSQLSRQICHHNTNREGFIPIVALSPEWERTFIESLVDDGSGDKQLSMAPSKLQDFVVKVKKSFDEQAVKGHVPVLLTSAYTRPYVRSVVERFRPSTVVMSQNEIHYKAKIRTLDSI
ncbi:MAG: flagellar biosynthesis protein FlhA [Rickettsiaceae bacterium]|nr:flagellar biosynthesis protein FlhA [Rickettsiaceae bacterium]MDP4832745.1 flagellar biosynthesis protein FlhA [Rickettsiaceae bacterium]MDP5020867.1 flagellar biosynthesis protein FlhA [Rickettsiaceae bacterium]MDP5082968.1 flagellar biosynthesis protein FlhA [Rickettsiaceae bacterium]